MGPARGNDGRRRDDHGKDVRSSSDSGPAAGPAPPLVRAPRARDDEGTGDGGDVRMRPLRFYSRRGSSYRPNSFPTGSTNTKNVPIPGPISVRGVRTRPPAAPIRFNVSAMTSTMM